MGKKPDLFRKDTERSALEAVVKNLEPRWGLTLVSFLPPAAHRRLLVLQGELARRWQPIPETERRKSDPAFSFYGPEHFHITHLTLRRSNAWGPVTLAEFVRPERGLYELFERVAEATGAIQPLTVVLDRLVLGRDGLSLVLLGYCAGEQSKGWRVALLGELNRSLREPFFVESRSWDDEPEQYHRVHCALGILKRPPGPYAAFRDYLARLTFEPVVGTLDTVSLVHHRFRSLAPPQEGQVDFRLGEAASMGEGEFASRLNLAP